MLLRTVLFVALGGGLGFGVHRFIGCRTGACPLTSHPIVRTLYGMVVGGLIAASFR